MPKTNAPPASAQLPPIRMEQALFEALLATAQKEGRTISDLVRCYLREQVERRRQTA